MSDGEMRNRPCPCGSGKKYKKCCYHKKRGYRETAPGQWECKHTVAFKILNRIGVHIGQRCKNCGLTQYYQSDGNKPAAPASR